MPATAAAPSSKKVLANLDQPMNKQGEVMRAGISDYKGKQYASVRVHYTDSTSGNLLPGKNGINVALDEVPKLIKALKHIEAGLR